MQHYSGIKHYYEIKFCFIGGAHQRVVPDTLPMKHCFCV